jgi:hypothetical protein
LEGWKHPQSVIEGPHGLPEMPHLLETDSHIQIGVRTVVRIQSDALVEMHNAHLVLTNVEQTRTQIKGQLGRSVPVLSQLLENLNCPKDILLLVGLNPLLTNIPTSSNLVF